MLNDADQTLVDRLTGLGISVRPAEPSYLEEPRGLYRGQGGLVAKPLNVEDVATIVRACCEAKIAVVPFGGGTGLVSGQISPDVTPLILSLEKMNAIRSIHPQENTIIAEAGATIAEVQSVADGAKRLFPLSYASKDSATVGGGLSVNSGGLNVLRYGVARNLCLGIEAVMPDGQVLNGLRRLRKDNSGYDLRNLLIGAEGTLGVITAASLRLTSKPDEFATAFLVVPDPASALTLLSQCHDIAGEIISAFELIPAQSFLFLEETFPDLRLPFAASPDWSVLVELATGRGGSPNEDLAAIYEAAEQAGLVTDGAIAQSGQQRDDFWQVREMIPEANRRIGAVASHDISLPLSEIPAFIDEARVAINARYSCRINAFGHMGDGNLHYNIFPPKGETRDKYRHLAEKITRTVHDLVAARDGSFSAEHGVGRAKSGELALYGDPVKLSVMRTIKSALDPYGIMNPGAVLPD